MSSRLRDLIKAVRACKTAQEERECVSKECAAIRTCFKEEEVDSRHRNVAKLLYIHMLGYSTHWGQMEVLKLIASGYYSDKRIGYLGLMLLMDERQELLTMATNHMKNDLNHPSHFVAGLALCALGNISSAGIARDLAPEVEKLLASTNPYIRKKAALCAIRVLRKCPDLMENFVPRIRSLLTERNHGVLLTGVSLMIELCEHDPNNIEFFRKLVTTLVRVLKNLVMSGYAPEYDVSGITDPFLQVKILKLLRLLGKGDQESSDITNDILAQVATNTDHTRNVGNSILYECVQTIMSIESEKDLRVLAINVLGGFLSNKDNNIRYVALNTLTKVVSQDAEAVQRHRNTIVDCLKDPDVSIRRRALDLIYALVNENNITVLAGELLSFLQNSSVEFRGDLAAKLCDVTERFSPNKRWHVDTILKVMTVSGNYVPDEVAANLISLIAATPDLHSYAVQRMYMALQQDISQSILVQVAVWCIGEFGELLVAGGGELDLSVEESNVVDLLTRVIKSETNTVTKEYILTALMKLTSRFTNSLPRLKQLISTYQNNINVELQQRSCEYTALFKFDGVRQELLKRIPVVEERAEQTARTVHVVKDPVTHMTNLIDIMDDIPSKPSSSSTPVASTGSQEGFDVMKEIFGDMGSLSPAPAITNTNNALDLLGLDTPAPSSPSPAPAPSTGGIPSLLGDASPSFGDTPLNGPLPTYTAYERNGLKITFDVIKNAQVPNVTVVNVSFWNNNSAPIMNFEFKTAVPKYIKLQVSPPSGNLIQPNSSSKLTQSFKVMNTMHGQQPLMLKIKLDYLIGGSPVSDLSDVTFPPGV